jgi:hypothetical protein
MNILNMNQRLFAKCQESSSSSVSNPDTGVTLICTVLRGMGCNRLSAQCLSISTHKPTRCLHQLARVVLLNAVRRQITGLDPLHRLLPLHHENVVA